MKTKRTKKTNKCKLCGAKAEKSTICINMWLADVDYAMHQCSNKKCPWHVQPHIYYDAYDKFKAKGFVEQCDYIDRLVNAYSEGIHNRFARFANDDEYAVHEWNLVHEKKVEESSCITEKVCYTNKIIEHDSIADLEL